MNLKKTGIILAVFAVLGAYFYFFEIKGTEKKEARKKEEAKLFPAFTRDNLGSFSLTSGKTTLICQKSQGAWTITEKKTSKADENAVHGWIGSFVAASQDQVIEDEAKDFAPYGLTAPALLVHAESADHAVKADLAFGNGSPTNSLAYVRLNNGKAVLAVKAPVRYELDKKFFDLRDKTVLPLDQKGVDRIAVDSAKGHFEFVKRNDHWFIQKPIQARAKDVRVNQMVDDVHFATVKEFTEEPLTHPAKYGLAPPSKHVTYWTGQLKQTLDIGKKKQGVYYASRSGISDCIQIYEYIGNIFPDNIDDVVEKKLYDFVSWDSQTVEVTAPDIRLKAAKDNGKWKVETPANIKASDLDLLMSTIQSLEYQKRFKSSEVPAAKGGWDQPLAKITFTVKDKPGAHTLTIGKMLKDGKTCYARGDDPGEVYILDSAVLQKIPKPAAPATTAPAPPATK